MESQDQLWTSSKVEDSQEKMGANESLPYWSHNCVKSYDVNFDDTIINIFLDMWFVLYIDLRNLSFDITQCNAFPSENNLYNINTQRERKYAYWLTVFIDK